MKKMKYEVLVTRYPRSNAPVITWKHECGPLMTLVDGKLHWITWKERILLFLGLTNPKEINNLHLSKYSIPHDAPNIEVVFMSQDEADALVVQNLYQWPRV